MPEPYEVLDAQNADEFAAFITILKRENVRSYLEIGAKFGSSFWAAASALPVGSRVVAVDLEGGTRAWPESGHSLSLCAGALYGRGYDARICWGDSTDPKVVEKVTALGPFDACFIDANHTLPYVAKDWKNYGSLARIVAFHDIAWRRAPEWQGGTRIDVPEFWNSIKGGYRHEEFKLQGPKFKDWGIGVLWRNHPTTALRPLEPGQHPAAARAD